MFADELLYFSLGSLVESVIGGPHIGEFGIAAPLGEGASGEQ